MWRSPPICCAAPRPSYSRPPSAIRALVNPNHNFYEGKRLSYPPSFQRQPPPLPTATPNHHKPPPPSDCKWAQVPLQDPGLWDSWSYKAALGWDHQTNPGIINFLLNCARLLRQNLNNITSFGSDITVLANSEKLHGMKRFEVS